MTRASRIGAEKEKKVQSKEEDEPSSEHIFFESCTFSERDQPSTPGTVAASEGTNKKEKEKKISHRLWMQKMARRCEEGRKWRIAVLRIGFLSMSGLPNYRGVLPPFGNFVCRWQASPLRVAISTV